MWGGASSWGTVLPMLAWGLYKKGKKTSEQYKVISTDEILATVGSKRKTPAHLLKQNKYTDPKYYEMKWNIYMIYLYDSVLDHGNAY